MYQRTYHFTCTGFCVTNSIDAKRTAILHTVVTKQAVATLCKIAILCKTLEQVFNFMQTALTLVKNVVNNS